MFHSHTTGIGHYFPRPNLPLASFKDIRSFRLPKPLHIRCELVHKSENETTGTKNICCNDSRLVWTAPSKLVDLLLRPAPQDLLETTVDYIFMLIHIPLASSRPVIPRDFVMFVISFDNTEFYKRKIVVRLISSSAHLFSPRKER